MSLPHHFVEASGFIRLGFLQTRPTRQQPLSRWSIGGETLDRDYTSYDAFKTYLDDLGAKRIRLQGGWARCERVKGHYDFAWLDAIVDDALARGVQPWLELSYGNPIYEGGGAAALAGGIPHSTQALAAWDAWVQSMVMHFDGRVNEWEIWNEPDLGEAHATPKFTAREFALFHCRTVDTVLAVQPEARIIGLALAHLPLDRPAHLGGAAFVDTVLDVWAANGHAEKLYAVTYHQYCHVPEKHYPAFEAFRTQVRACAPHVQFWQGEAGAPSTPADRAVGALSDIDWDEWTQAKWVLRRMAGDMAHGVDLTNIFQMADMYYATDDHFSGLNPKGLLEANPDCTIKGPKQSYHAYRFMASLFGGGVRCQARPEASGGKAGLEAHLLKGNGEQDIRFVYWQGGALPETGEGGCMESVDFILTGVNLRDPVLVDPLHGTVWSVPEGRVIPESGGQIRLEGFPVLDRPLVLAERNSIHFEP